MARVLAFDFGASTGRAICAEYDGTNFSYSEVYRFDNKITEENGCLCWDFDYLLKNVKNAVDAAGKIDSLAFDTWGVDFGMIDSNGRLLKNPVCYRDGRTGKAYREVLSKISKKDLYASTGNQIMPINTLFQLACEDLSDVKKILFMPDLFAYSLCGAQSTDVTIASTSQMLNMKNFKWDREAFSLTDGKDLQILPEICSTAAVAGEYKGIKVIKVAGHDTQCAVAAMPCRENENCAFLSCGTWSLIGCENDNAILTEKSMTDELSNEVGADFKINYLKNISGLWLIQEIRRNFRDAGREYSYNDMEQLARKEAPFAHFINPDDAVFASPGNIPQKIREYCKNTSQKIPENDGALIRCIYESLALKYKTAVEQIEANTGRHFETLHLLGGGTKDTFLCQMTADSLNIPVIAGPVEATALGNIILQLIALGELKNIGEGRKLISKTEKLTTYKPNQPQNFESAYEKYVKIINN